MKIVQFHPSVYLTSQWSGGTTTQIAIAPEGALYADRDFLWRVSSATVELERSDFTPLPQYNRFISLLSGEMILAHDGGAEHALAPYEVCKFDGASETVSKGKCVDFNLMVRKDQVDGDLCGIVLAAGEDCVIPPKHSDCTMLLYCTAGKGCVSIHGQSWCCGAGESMMVEHPGKHTLKMHCSAGGSFMLAQMWKK